MDYSKVDLDKDNLFEFDKIKAAQIMESNKNIYNEYMKIINILLEKKDYSMVTGFIYQITDIITRKHPGFFTSPQLEIILKECAQNTPNVQPEFKFKNTNERKVLHIMSEAYEVGGHTRLVKRWIEADKDSTHSLVNIWNENTFPRWLREAVVNSGGEVYTLPGPTSDFMKNGALLRNIAYDWADIVVLHVHMMDPTPSIAFGIDGGPPIVYMNHYDHGFWLGASIADVVVDITQIGTQLSLRRRGITNSMKLPIPINYIKNNLDRNELRKKYNISENSKVLITIASEHKFTSVNDLDYCQIAKEIINNTDDTIIIVIGPRKEGKWETLCKDTNERVRVLGIVSNVEEFYALADIYLESYVLGSYTSRLDGILNGLAGIKLKNNLYPKLTDMFDELELLSFDTINQLIDCINKYENDEKNEIFIKANQMRNFVIKENVNSTYEYISKIYDSVKEHKVNEVKVHDEIEDIDLIWALFNN